MYEKYTGPYVKMLFYGPYGIGKTHLIKTGVGDPRIFPMLMLNFEGGALSIASKIHKLDTIRKYFRQCKEENKPKRAYINEFREYLNQSENASIDFVDVLKVETWDDLEDILDILADGSSRYASIAIDSLTEINYLVLREITEEAGKVNPSKHDGELSQLQDYGRAATRLRRVVRTFRDLPMNCIFTALPQESKDETYGTTETRPSLVGKLSEEVPAMFDITGYMQSPKPRAGGSNSEEESMRTIYFQPTNKFRAKDRSEGGKLGDSMTFTKEDPTLVTIFNKLEIPMPPKIAVKASKTKAAVE